MNEPVDPRTQLLASLAREGLTIEPLGAGDAFRIGSAAGRQFRHDPVFTVPQELLAEYLAELAQSCRDQPDPTAEALSLTLIHATEYLTTDHGHGLNATTALGFRRTPDGRVEFWVEQDRPVVGHPIDGELEWVADPDQR